MSNLPVNEFKRSKYRILGLIGQGQFGRVYCALHRKTGRLVALKALDRDRFPTHKFLRELRFLLSLQHPNIVICEALEHGQDGRYLVMDYCEGGTLRDLMENHNSFEVAPSANRLHPALSVKLVTDVLAGIDHAHSRGIVHCDIKPENILLSLEPTGWIARISDFGIARLSQELTSEEANITGSPAYMAPERFYGQYSQSTDLYAVGVLLFELLVGQRPFSGVPAELMSAHLNQPVKVPEHIPVSLKTVILTALQKLKARRFQSATQMLDALRLAVSQCPELQVSPQEALAISVNMPSLSPCRILREEILRHRVEQIAITERSWLAGYDRYVQRTSLIFFSETLAKADEDLESQVRCRSYVRGLMSANSQQGEEIQALSIAEPIQELIVRPLGCFAVTERSLYLVSEQGAELLTRFHQPSRIAIEPNGRWIAVATLNSEQGMSVFSVWKLSDCTLMSTPTVCDEIQDMPLLKLLAIDSAHVAAFSQGEEQTHLDLFNRRGQATGKLYLSVILDQVIQTPNPYCLAATEPRHPKALLLVHLKPLKLIRVAIDITPQFLAAMPWGLVVMDSEGQMILLDYRGQKLARLAAPKYACAIAPIKESGLLVATWHQGQGELYTLGLEGLGVRE